MGALSWSRIRVRLLTSTPFLPSNSTRAEIVPSGLSFLFAAREATTKFGKRKAAKDRKEDFYDPGREEDISERN